MNHYSKPILILSEKKVSPSSASWLDTALGDTLEVRSQARNLFNQDISLGRSIEGLKGLATPSLSRGSGSHQDGFILWEPRANGDFVDIELPEVNPADFLKGDGTGIFVAVCLSLQVKTEVALNLEIAGQTEDAYQPQPGFVAANPEQWQRINSAVRIFGPDKAKARLRALGPGRVCIGTLQFDPRPYPVWMVTEPMRTGLWGAWTPGGTTRTNDNLWAELHPGDIGASGAIMAWIQSDWPSSDFPHTVFDVESGALSCAFNNGRLIGAAGGSEVWICLSTDWRYMMRFEPGRWHHLALTWHAEGEVALYVDGECYARRHTPTALRLDPSKLPSRLYLGCPSREEGFQAQPDMPGRLDGLLADVRIYPDAPDDGAIAAIHTAGRSLMERGPVEVVDVRLGNDELIAESPFYCWFPNKIGKMLDGSIELFCGCSPDYGLKHPVYWPKQRLHFRKASLIAPWQSFHPRWVLGRQPLQLPDGRWLSWAIDLDRPPGAQHQGALPGYVISNDGVKWEPFQAELRLPDNERYHVSQFVVDSAGRVLLLGSIRLKGSQARPHSLQDSLFGPKEGETHLFLAESRDSGQTFEFLSLVTEGRKPPFGDYCEENALIDVSQDRPGGPKRGDAVPELLMVGRIRGHQVPCIQMRSTDGGRTWSALELCPFGAVFPRMVRLQNGVVVLLTGRPETVLHWTTDGGRTWSPPISLYDSREQPLQSENIWYGPSTGYGALTEVEPNRLWVSYDLLGAYNPETLKRTNQVHVRDVRVERLTGKAHSIPLGSFNLLGDWSTLPGEVAWTNDTAAKAELDFEGPAIALVHPVLRHGGQIRAFIDGVPVREVSCYDPLPHHAFAKTALASGLKDGRHHLVLESDLSSQARHAHGDGAELSGILAWLHMAHCRSERWVGLCGVEIVHG